MERHASLTMARVSVVFILITLGMGAFPSCPLLDVIMLVVIYRTGSQ
jgi:hypothetical protein